MTETQTVDLASWLTAIWDEDEAEARKEKYHDDAWWMDGPFDADFVLARIAADRKILELHTRAESYAFCQTCIRYGGGGFEDEPWPCPTLRLLASPYKGREGWQEEWE